MDNKYNHALHEFEDCIDDYGKGKERYLTRNEFILYNCILNCFITRLEEQAENLETMKCEAICGRVMPYFDFRKTLRSEHENFIQKDRIYNCIKLK